VSDVSDDPKLPESPYAPPRSESQEQDGRRVTFGSAPVAAIAAGVLVSIAWALYIDWSQTGTIGQKAWLRIVSTAILWGGLASLLVAGVSWARIACRGLAILTVIGGLVSMLYGGSIYFYLVAAVRTLIFGAVFQLLRAPVRRRSTRQRAASTSP
jgi:hypothetical protein